MNPKELRFALDSLKDNFSQLKQQLFKHMAETINNLPINSLVLYSSSRAPDLIKAGVVQKSTKSREGDLKLKVRGVNSSINNHINTTEKFVPILAYVPESVVAVLDNRSLDLLGLDLYPLDNSDTNVILGLENLEEEEVEEDDVEDMGPEVIEYSECSVSGVCATPVQEEEVSVSEACSFVYPDSVEEE